MEINPIIANTIMRKNFPQLSQNLYLRPDVRIEVEDGRSFIRRSPEKYQILQATLVDTWASTAAGAFALSENNLYTTDAFYDYLSHLTDDGVLPSLAGASIRRANRCDCFPSRVLLSTVSASTTSSRMSW